ncbi:acyltransferase [Mycobacterium saskatchewanense]|uniref:Acyltransferase n=1 Tax=Mycobacterium saskatchewanense TaxID=220927 RepID=A0AAJ3NL32_9MYCO|nr:condensation domain-containing protein [Mycobacterium saskatchewanense]ORW64882.1 acyltransferase [Mycobacterium saskatchewanense]BBX62935.1 acyltransferase [Mycobacterium saskatchewanense]
MRVGPLGVGTLFDWQPAAGRTVSWQPTAATAERARHAPVSSVPVSYMQAQHIRGYAEQKAKGLDYSRLMIVSSDVPGRCDIRAANYVVNAHVRRHDTYRSRFEYTDDGRIIRRTLPDATGIEFEPVDHGELALDEIRQLAVSTPDPLQWGCFQFGVIQGEEHFTFYASVDHVHVDAMLVGVTLTEFHMMYASLVSGGAPLELPEAGSYDDFCIRQRAFTDALTAESPQIRLWRQFAESNGGSLPEFPLPLGDPSRPSESAIVTATMLDEEQTGRFESACTAAGARFIGGVLACCGLAEYELTGAANYYGLTPRDTRKTPTDALTQGWFTGLIPITAPIAGSSFEESARAAQASFDMGVGLAEVPYDRVVELAPTVHPARPNFPVVNFLDAGTAPLSVLLTAELDGLNVGVYSDNRYSYQLSIYVIRVAQETAVTVMFPDTPEAHQSVPRYLSVLRSVFQRVAESGQWRNVA